MRQCIGWPAGNQYSSALATVINLVVDMPRTILSQVAILLSFCYAPTAPLALPTECCPLISNGIIEVKFNWNSIRHLPGAISSRDKWRIWKQIKIIDLPVSINLHTLPIGMQWLCMYTRGNALPYTNCLQLIAMFSTRGFIYQIASCCLMKIIKSFDFASSLGAPLICHSHLT